MSAIIHRPKGPQLSQQRHIQFIGHAEHDAMIYFGALDSCILAIFSDWTFIMTHCQAEILLVGDSVPPSVNEEYWLSDLLFSFEDYDQKA